MFVHNKQIHVCDDNHICFDFLSKQQMHLCQSAVVGLTVALIELDDTQMLFSFCQTPEDCQVVNVLSTVNNKKIL